MAKKKHQNRDVSVSFTRVSEDVLVPTWMIDYIKTREQMIRHPIKMAPFVWGVGRAVMLAIFRQPSRVSLNRRN